MFWLIGLESDEVKAAPCEHIATGSKQWNQLCTFQCGLRRLWRSTCKPFSPKFYVNFGDCCCATISLSIFADNETDQWGLAYARIHHSHHFPSPVILWIELGGKPKWLPLNLDTMTSCARPPFSKYLSSIFLFLSSSSFFLLFRLKPVWEKAKVSLCQDKPSLCSRPKHILIFPGLVSLALSFVWAFVAIECSRSEIQ